MTLRKRALPLIAGLSIIAVAGCGMDGSEVEPTPPEPTQAEIQTDPDHSPVETTEPEDQTAASTPDSPELDEEADLSAPEAGRPGFSVEPQASANYEDFTLDVGHDTMQVLSEIRVGSHDGYERLVFEYSESTDLAFYAHYHLNDPNEEAVEGWDSSTAQALLVVEVLGTTGGEDAEQAARTESWSPTSQEAMVREIRPGELDGGESELLIFLDQQRPFHIHQETEPNRIIIDIAN